MWTRFNELALNIETEPAKVRAATPDGTRHWWQGQLSSKAAHDDNYTYACPDYWYVRKIVKLVRPGPSDVVYDVGCGMGRIVCDVARSHVKKCVGVELFEPLCEIARKNAGRLRGRKSPIEIICNDAAKADLSDGTVYFMFNPFGPDTMRDVIENIHRSLSPNPRAITICYYNALYDAVLADGDWLERYHQFHTAGGLKVSFWKNRHFGRA